MKLKLSSPLLPSRVALFSSSCLLFGIWLEARCFSNFVGFTSESFAGGKYIWQVVLLMLNILGAPIMF